MRKVTTTVSRVVAVTAAAAGFMIASSAVASAAPVGTSIDPTCLEEGTAVFLADPIGTLTASVADPVGTLDAEIACVTEVIGG